MTQQTGEDQMGLRKILDFTRMASIVLLLLHFYFHACPGCSDWQSQTPIADRLMASLKDTGFFDSVFKAKLFALVLLVCSLLGSRGRKMPDYTVSDCVGYLSAGLFLYWASGLLLGTPALYYALCGAGYLLILHACNYFTRIVWSKQPDDIFNRLHASFPQEERLLDGAFSINLPARYADGSDVRDSWINIVDPFRGTLVLGSPGSGKTWYIVEPMIRQYIEKGFALLLYDFKYDDLSRLAYNHFQKYKETFPKTRFYTLHFGDLDQSHRCNPLGPVYLSDIHDAGEAARAVLLGMNKEGLRRQGEFFLESSVNFVQAVIWFLRCYENGKYCSWPHVIELARSPYRKLFTILRVQPHLKPLMAPFINALKNEAPEQLEGQIASATIALARLASPQVYYVMTGNDFSLDLNDPAAPKILTIGNDPQKADTYGPMISAYVNTINRLVNRKDRHPLAVIFDEFSTVTVHTIDRSIATGRSNKIAITLCTQNSSQLRLAYGREFADVVVNSCGNVLCGQVTGEMAQEMSVRIGKTMQERESLTASSGDVSVTQSQQLEYSIPVSRIASLSSGEFVGLVADTPAQPIGLKTFCCQMVNDPEALDLERAAFKELPPVKKVSDKMLNEHFALIGSEIEQLVEAEMNRISLDAALKTLLL